MLHLRSNLSKRLRVYFSIDEMTKYKPKSLIYSALIKYGHKVFNLDILENCSKQDLIKREQYYIDTLNPQYNIIKTAGSSLGRNLSEETKAKLRYKRSKEFCAGVR